jgi:hypothetical protein
MRKCLKDIEDRNKKHNCTRVGGRLLFDPTYAFSKKKYYQYCNIKVYRISFSEMFRHFLRQIKTRKILKRNQVWPKIPVTTIVPMSKTTPYKKYSSENRKSKSIKKHT